jgi:hypothetical protein
MTQDRYVALKQAAAERAVELVEGSGQVEAAGHQD